MFNNIKHQRTRYGDQPVYRIIDDLLFVCRRQNLLILLKKYKSGLPCTIYKRKTGLKSTLQHKRTTKNKAKDNYG